MFHKADQSDINKYKSQESCLKMLKLMIRMSNPINSCKNWYQKPLKNKQNNKILKIRSNNSVLKYKTL